ncbi:FUSC family protein [Schauerella aestuarii]|uniref:FUSC family protein n=1 Tax=Schauerella aestuarii TaxID=2511204 RepID=UPI00136A000B|nr:FUSC family protein [Achromobacter aestuarii]MYZ45896.1 FUSC family protein [Achromobacter aestuarii]
MGEHNQICRAAVASLGRELAAWRPSRDRATFGVETVLSVALAVGAAHALHLSNTWWAAISGFAVMQTSFTGSVQRAAHRMLGTLSGAVLGIVAGSSLGDRPWLFVPVLAGIGGVAVYYGNGSRAPYAWVLGGVTALLVTYEAHLLLSVRSTAIFAALRVAEVAVGTVSCVIVTSAFHFGPRWYARARARPAVPAPAHADHDVGTPAMPDKPSSNAMQPGRVLLSVQSALAVAILATLTYSLNLPGFAQAMVTAIAVLILPAGAPAHDMRRPITEKMMHRLLGCLLAGALGIALLPLMQGQVVLCMLALSFGVWIGCHVQTGQEGASYVGRQFTIAFIMVFVQDHQWSADPVPALMRLSGILAGIVVITAVVLATSRLHGPSAFRISAR